MVIISKIHYPVATKQHYVVGVEGTFMEEDKLADKLAQQVKAPKPNNLSLIPRARKLGSDLQTHAVVCVISPDI